MFVAAQSENDQPGFLDENLTNIPRQYFDAFQDPKKRKKTMKKGLPPDGPILPSEKVYQTGANIPSTGEHLPQGYI